MRLLFPERFSLVAVFYFAGLLCAIQQFQGTDSTFSLCCFAYILVAAVAFNIAGGFTRTTGAFIFFNSVLGVIIGLCVKAYLDEPADSNLQSPVLTMTVYLAGMCMMLVAALLSRKFATKRALLGKMVTDVNMQTSTVGCMVTGLLLYFSGSVFTGGNGTVWSALNQLNRFLPMAIMLGVLNTIRRSRGTRSINLPVVLSAAFMFINGVLNFSKEAMFTPFICWLLVASSQRLRISRSQMLGIGAATFIIFYYLVPYSQYGRNFREEAGGVNVQTSVSLLSDLGHVREQYFASSSDNYDDRIIGYFNTPQGFFDRLEMVAIDDALTNHTKQFGSFGIYPVIQSFENVVPHFLWPDKPPLLTGNTYAHEVGLLGPEDDSTGVSFSSTAVAFHLLGWYGVFFLAPSLWFLLFTVFDSLCGDVRKSPWGLLVMVLFAHAAPEGDLNSIIYMIFYGAFGIIFAALMGAYVMPVIGTFFIGPEGIALRRGAQIRSLGGRLLPLARNSQASPSEG
jgi:hypothetical protein